MKKIKSSELELNLSIVSDLTGGGSQTKMRDESGVEACETQVEECGGQSKEDDQCEQTDTCFSCINGGDCAQTLEETCECSNHCSDECTMSLSHNVLCCEYTMQPTCNNTGLCPYTDTNCSVQEACVQTQDGCIDSNTCQMSDDCAPTNP